MKLTFVFVIFAIAVVAFASSSPVESDSEGELVRADRHRRLTCDLLSIQLPKFAVNHSACAAHCLAMFKGYTGGTCQNGICHCRK